MELGLESNFTDEGSESPGISKHNPRGKLLAKGGRDPSFCSFSAVSLLSNWCIYEEEAQLQSTNEETSQESQHMDKIHLNLHSKNKNKTVRNDSSPVKIEIGILE